MRVKLLIALAIASIFLLVSSLPAGAVEGIAGINSFSSIVGVPGLVAPVVTAPVIPGITAAFTAPIVAPCGPANLITLGGPALQAQFTLFAPQIPSFSPPGFALPSVVGPTISPFICTSPIFDP
jgi:hypothetical protein